jgi:hypothetical protein
MSRYLSRLINQTGLKISSRPTPALLSQSSLAPSAPVIPAPNPTEQDVQSENESMTPHWSEVKTGAPPWARTSPLTADRETATEEQLKELPVTAARGGLSCDRTTDGGLPSRDSQESKLLSLIEKETCASPLQKVRAWVAVASDASERPSPTGISMPSEATRPATRSVPPETAETPDVERKSVPKVTSSSSRVSLPGIARRPHPAWSASSPAELDVKFWSVNIGAIHVAIEAAQEKTSLRPAESRPAPATLPPTTNSSRLWRYYLRPF